MMKHRHLKAPLIGVASLAVAAILVAASPRGNRMFLTEGGPMMVFPGDSIDLSTMTFIIDGDTVSRERFSAVTPRQIYSLTVTKSPANCVELITRQAMERPLPADTMPSGVRLSIDGVEVDAATLSRLPDDSVAKVTVVRGRRPAVMVTTRH